MTLHTETARNLAPVALPSPVGTDQAAIEAELTFLIAGQEKPKTYMPAPEGGEIERTGTYAPVRVPIHDARPIARDLSLDDQGFALTRHDTAVEDFFDEEEIKHVYYPEMERVVKAATGASRVLVFDHNLRVEGGPDRDNQGVQAPVRMVHNDYTAKSGAQRTRDFLGEEEGAAALAKRVAVINVWRPIEGPVESAPLALADAQTIAPDELVPLDLVYPDRVGEIYNATYGPNQRWYHVPHMARHEALLIKGYDSKEDGRARFTLHTAFDDPTAPVDAAPRKSIEVRTLAIFED